MVDGTATPARGLAWASYGLVALIWGLMVFGASVRVHGAGLACPDWPLCFGEVIPTIDFGVFFEFGHRVVAGTVSLLYLALGVAVWRRGGTAARRLWGVGLAVLVVQVILGGLTVLELLAEWTVTSHLLAGNTFCLTVLLLGLRLDAQGRVIAFPEGVTRLQRGLAVVLGLSLLVQLTLGGLVSSSHAGLVCPAWPSCAGSSWFPTFEGLVGLQVTHRLVGYVVGAVVLALFLLGVQNRTLRAPTALLVGLVLVQIGLGVANVLLRLPVEITLAHTGVAAWLVLGTTWLMWRAFRAPLAQPAPRAALAGVGGGR